MDLTGSTFFFCLAFLFAVITDYYCSIILTLHIALALYVHLPLPFSFVMVDPAALLLMFKVKRLADVA